MRKYMKTIDKNNIKRSVRAHFIRSGIKLKYQEKGRRRSPKRMHK